MQDEAYGTEDRFVGTFGPSWLHRWGIARGIPVSMRDEPDPPTWVMERYQREVGRSCDRLPLSRFARGGSRTAPICRWRSNVVPRGRTSMPPLIAGRRHDRLADAVLAEQLERAAGADDEDVAVLARQIDPAVGGDWRRAEAAAAMREALAVDLGARSPRRSNRTAPDWRACRPGRRRRAASACRGRAASSSTRRSLFERAPPASVMSPGAPGRIAKIGRSGARPLATRISPPAAIGVGAVIFELPPSRQSSLPVSGS